MTPPDAPTVGRLWYDTAHPAAWNMAADDYLLQHWSAQADCALRLYSWDPAAVSIGYFQPHREVAPADLAWVRRPTGGGVVRHDADLTVTLVVGKRHPFMAVDRFESYRLVNAAIMQAFSDIGITDLSLHPEDIPDAVARELLVCFDTPAKWDVIGPHGKVAGGAQRRTAKGLLHQGSIDLRHYPVLNADRSALSDAVAARLAEMLELEWRTCPPTDDERTQIAALAESKYGHTDWNEKR